jgi:hypothetical protein
MVTAKRLAISTEYLEIHDENRISGGVDWRDGVGRKTVMLGSLQVRVVFLIYRLNGKVLNFFLFIC